jgi:enoyl-[acyl-carrier protein] reductase I
MSNLQGKNALVFGVANDHSIAWGIAKALHAAGATVAFTYAFDTLEKRVRPLAESLGASFIERCDVSNDEEIERTFAAVNDRVGNVDVLVHAIAFANREDLAGRFVDTSRAGFALAHDVSVYSLVALARAVEPLMPEGGSILTMTYYGAEKVVPRYNVMGVAKAALEATVRYLAADLGPQGIRVNAISAGPIRTLSASAIAGFRDMHRRFAEANPLRRAITIDDVGALAAFLASDASAAITGEVVYVDGGYNIMGMTAPEPREEK